MIEVITAFDHGMEVGKRKELIRCKDCKHKWWVNSENRKIVCRYCYGEHEPDWFCGDGEKQTKRRLSAHF